MALSSLRARLLLLLVVIPAAMTVPLVLLIQHRTATQSRAWLESRSLGVARLLAIAVAPATDFDDEAAAGLALRHLEAVSGASYAALHRPDRSLLSSWRAGPSPRGWPPAGGGAVAFEAGLVHVAVPVTSRIGPPATLVVGFTLDELAERQAEVRWLAVAAGGFLLVMAGATALAGSRFLVRPLGRITDVARRITAGEAAAHQDLDLRRADEVGTLARAFDVMLGRLRQQRAELQQREESARALNGHLEDRVEERTGALAAANLTLQHRLAELRAAQEQLVVSERRAGVGQLAAGVAHEVNNPLSYVSGNLAFLADQLAEVQQALHQGGEEGQALARQALAEVGPALADARQGATRVHQIVRGLKAFSRGDDDVRVPVDVEAALAAAIEMALHEIKHRALLERDVRPLPRVEASEVRLTQVFLNLLVNAAQALPAGNAAANRVRLAAFTDAAGRAVVEVSDTGHGIPPEVRARLFEPFFTTKPAGIGTGLGLAISQGIVTSYGGAIEVESEPGHGATFRVLLPPSSRVQVAAPTPAAPATAAPRLRLLVVDDEAAVAAALERQLARFHEVVAVRSAALALERIGAGERFDRVLCDLEMPQVDGTAFQAGLAEVAPELAASLLFMTGGAFTETAVRTMARERARVLEKPVDVDLLLRRLRET